MSNDEPSLERIAILAAVAESYYIDRDSQDLIAAKYGFSRSNISRMLTEARQAGLVEIRVNNPMPTCSDREARLSSRFPGVRFIVAKVEGAQEQRHRQLGMLAWRQVERHLEPHATIGISWGRALSLMVENARPVTAPEARIVELGGAQDAVAGDQTTRVAELLGRRLGLPVVRFPSPLLADDANAARVLLEQSSVRAVVDVARGASAAVVGIGAIKEKLRGSRRSRIDTESAYSLQSAGAVGDIGGYHFDGEGREIDCLHNHRVVGIGAGRYRALSNKIAVAFGPAKDEAIRAALAGGWVDELVTDLPTADAVLDLPHPEPLIAQSAAPAQCKSSGPMG